jgi:hypothetical protein
MGISAVRPLQERCQPTRVYFVLKTEEQHMAIYWDITWRPEFGRDEIAILNDCNTNTRSHIYGFGRAYINDTGLDGETFFTGATYFTMKEMGVFEIANSITLVFHPFLSGHCT